MVFNVLTSFVTLSPQTIIICNVGWISKDILNCSLRDIPCDKAHRGLIKNRIIGLTFPFEVARSALLNEPQRFFFFNSNYSQSRKLKV